MDIGVATTTSNAHILLNVGTSCLWYISLTQVPCLQRIIDFRFFFLTKTNNEKTFKS